MAVHPGVMNTYMQGVANTAPATFYTASGNPVQIINVGAHDDRNQSYNACAAKGLGITQIVLGILIFGIQIYITVLEATGYQGFSGLWASVFFILAGAFGIQSSMKKTKCSVVTTLVLCIIAAVLSVAVIVQGTLGAIFQYFDEESCYDGTSEEHNISYRRCRTDTEIVIGSAFHSVMSILGFIEGVIAIIAAAFCCGCCRNSRPGVVLSQGPGAIPGTGMQVTTVHYNGNGAPYPHTYHMGAHPTQGVMAGYTNPTPPPSYREKGYNY